MLWMNERKARAKMGRVQLFFFERAGAFVFVAWAQFLAAIFADYKIGLPIIISDFYGDPQIVWPVHTTIVRCLFVATVLALCVAIGASIAVATSHRALASIAVFGVWIAFAVGGTISIALAPAGPQELFDRFVGNQKFSMPRRYKVANEGESGGFAFGVCLDPFDERDRQRCQQSAYVSVRPSSEGMQSFKDVKFWQDNRHTMKKLEPVFSHEQFEFTWPLDYDQSKTASNFYLVRYDGDRLARLVRCYGKSAVSDCTQYVFSEEYILMIDSKMWALEHWLDVEQNVAALIASWRMPTLH
jgi:hypothetical protein